MEDSREVITLGDIKTYLLKEAIKVAIVLPVMLWVFGLVFIAANYLFQLFFMYIIAATAFLLGLIGTTISIIKIIKIKNNTYFKITTDVLVDKKEHISSGLWPSGLIVNRLFFKYNKYDLLKKSGYYDIYDMDDRAVFDTAFVGDTFTLVETKKEVVLAFNNKLFNVIID